MPQTSLLALIKVDSSKGLSSQIRFSVISEMFAKVIFSLE